MKSAWIIYIILICMVQIIINSGCAARAGLGQSPGTFQKCEEGLELDCWYSHKERSGYDKNGTRYYNPTQSCRCVKPGDHAIFYMTDEEANYFRYHEP